MNEKYNYDSFIVYDDPYFDKIKDYERNIRSPFWLKDEVKSLHVIETNSENKRQSSIKYIYDSNKSLITLTNYNSELKEVMNRNYYRFGNYDGESILKDGYSVLSPNIRKEFKSQIDRANKVVILETLENDKTKSIDSIFYQDNFMPTLIKKYGPSKDLQYTKMVEYIDNKTSLNLTFRTIGVSRGSKRFYNDQSKHISVSSISNIDVKTMEYYTITFNKDLNPTQIQYTSKENDKVKSITLEYNANEDLVSKYYGEKEVYDEEEFYEYEYDLHQNWTKRKMFVNNKLFNVMERKIEYYE